MQIKIKSNAKIAAVKVYSLESKEKEIIDKEFDKFHAQDRMQYSAKFIFHEYFVFVI